MVSFMAFQHKAHMKIEQLIILVTDLFRVRYQHQKVGAYQSTTTEEKKPSKQAILCLQYISYCWS